MDACGGDDVTEAEVMVAKELREVVEQNEEHTEGALVQQANLNE